MTTKQSSETPTHAHTPMGLQRQQFDTEDHATGEGCTPEQLEHRELTNRLAAYGLASNTAPSCAAVGWWRRDPRARSSSFLSDRNTVPIDPQAPVPVKDVMAVTLVPFACRRLRTFGSGWDIRVVESYAMCDVEDGRVIFGADAASQVYDGLRRSVQEQLLFEYSDSDTVYNAPFKGELRVVTNNRHTDMFIGRTLVYRLLNSNSNGYTMLHTDGRVRAGVPLFSVTLPNSVGCAKLGAHGQNLHWSPRPPHITASRASFMRFVNSGLHQLYQHVADGAPLAPHPADVVPQLLLQFSRETYETLQLDLSSLTNSTAVKRAMLAAVGPDGDFTHRAASSGELRELPQDSSSGVFNYAIGDTTYMAPACCQNYLRVAYGTTVTVGTPIADYSLRLVQDWATFAADIEPNLPWLTKLFLDHAAYVSGDGQVALPCAWLADTGVSGVPMVDFRKLAVYRDHTTGWISSPLFALPLGSTSIRGDGVTLQLDAQPQPKRRT